MLFFEVIDKEVFSLSKRGVVYGLCHLKNNIHYEKSQSIELKGEKLTSDTICFSTGCLQKEVGSCICIIIEYVV